jgi:beta-N-acetylhexosaminidase
MMVVGARAAGMVLGSLPFDAAEAERVAHDYIRAGIRAFALPGSFLGEGEKARTLTTNIRRMAVEAGLGQVLIAMGGAVHTRFELPYSPLAPSPLCVAASGSSAAARRSGRILGALAFNCGVDLVLGPRLELAGDPKDSLGSLDLFGADPRLVAELGSAFVRGLAAGGVASCVGRFPGLGSTCHAENREGIPLVDYPLDRLERCEMRPFSRAVKQGVDAVLVGRAFVPALEVVRIPAFPKRAGDRGKIEDRTRFSQTGYR